MFTSQELLLFVTLAATNAPKVELPARQASVSTQPLVQRNKRFSRGRDGQCPQCRRGSGRREILG